MNSWPVLEITTAEQDIKVTKEFINNLRALALRQKTEKYATEFATMLNNEKKHIIKDKNIDAIIGEFEIEEE
jgi:hypothetical protein